MTVVSRSGTETPVEVNAAPIRDPRGAILGCVLVFRDVTERRRNEERLRDAAKLESLGVLAGGIADDFNNLLVGIIGNASLLEEILPQDRLAREMLDGIQRAGERAAVLTRQMLAYSGRGQFLVEPLDLSAEVEQIAALLRASVPRDVQLRFSLAAALPRIQGDSSQLQQLILNLVLNAAEAADPEGHGWVEVATSAETLDENNGVPLVLSEDLPPGEYVVLRVADNGVGMDEVTRARIFEPFFTTKFTGRGLGLAAVLGIVRGHCGGVTVDSAPGRGTTFRVYLPASAREQLAGVEANRDQKTELRSRN